MTSNLFYVVAPLIDLWVAYRFYWKYGDYFVSLEHNILFLFTFNPQIAMFYAH